MNKALDIAKEKDQMLKATSCMTTTYSTTSSFPLLLFVIFVSTEILVQVTFTETMLLKSEP